MCLMVPIVREEVSIVNRPCDVILGFKSFKVAIKSGKPEPKFGVWSLVLFFQESSNILEKLEVNISCLECEIHTCSYQHMICPVMGSIVLHTVYHWFRVALYVKVHLIEMTLQLSSIWIAFPLVHATWSVIVLMHYMREYTSLRFDLSAWLHSLILRLPNEL